MCRPGTTARFLLLALAPAGLLGGACQSRPTDHASRAEVIAYLRREGAYRPANMRLRHMEWLPTTREWIVDVDERHEEPRYTEHTNLTVNATATTYRDDTCRF